jgi:hypothetical protein
VFDHPEVGSDSALHDLGRRTSGGCEPKAVEKFVAVHVRDFKTLGDLACEWRGGDVW